LAKQRVGRRASFVQAMEGWLQRHNKRGNRINPRPRQTVDPQDWQEICLEVDEFVRRCRRQRKGRFLAVTVGEVEMAFRRGFIARARRERQITARAWKVVKSLLRNSELHGRRCGKSKYLYPRSFRVLSSCSPSAS